METKGTSELARLRQSFKPPTVAFGETTECLSYNVNETHRDSFEEDDEPTP